MTTHDAYQRGGKWMLIEKTAGPRNAPARPMTFDDFADLLAYCKRHQISATLPNF